MDGETTIRYEEPTGVGLVVDLRGSPDWTRYEEELQQGKRAAIPEFYVSGVIKHRQTGRSQISQFRDDIEISGHAPFSRVYGGTFSAMSDESFGDWDLVVMIQNVNNASRDTKPEEMAKTVGGWLYSRSYALKPKGGTSGCTLEPKFDLSFKIIDSA